MSAVSFDEPNFARIAELARLDPLGYAQIRALEAEVMGVGVGALDEAVQRARRESREKSTSPVEVVEAWPDRVEGTDLLAQLESVYSRHLVLPPYAATAAALWIVHTYAIEAAACSPLLTWQSPTYRCGKTTAQTITQALASRAIMASNISPAAVYRFVDQHAPTLVLDEADTFMRENEQLRGILNSGHARAGAYVIRCDGADFQPRKFSTWCPKSIAIIGKLSVTLQDRSIVVPMRRRLPGEHVDALPKEPVDAFEPLRRQCRRWVEDNAQQLPAMVVQTICSLSDRASDNWRPLLQIAEVAGVEWREKARAAAVALSCSKHELVGVGQQLLADIRAYFLENAHSVRSRDLARHLETLEGRPWADWRGGHAISTHQIARLLTEFGVQPRTIRFTPEKHGTDKGYERTQFEDVFARYLPPETVTSSQP
jgi:putative DNA primase/helicase